MHESKLDFCWSKSLLIIFSQHKSSYSCKRLQFEAQKYQLDVLVTDYKTPLQDLQKTINKKKYSKIFFLPRLGLLDLNECFTYLAEINSKTNWHWINELSSLHTFKNKWLTHQFLENNNIPTVATQLLTVEGLSSDMNQIQLFIQETDSVYLKPSYSMQGYGIIRIHHKNNLDHLIKEIHSHVSAQKNKYYKNEWILQPSITTSLGIDVRCLILNKKIVNVFKRQNLNDPYFRSNIHLGGEIFKYTPSKQDLNLVDKIINLIQIRFPKTNFYALDFLVTEENLILNEINVSPGFQAAEKYEAYIKTNEASQLENTSISENIILMLKSI